MNCKCDDCGDNFEDNYVDVNDLNKRIWCNKCVGKRSCPPEVAK